MFSTPVHNLSFTTDFSAMKSRLDKETAAPNDESSFNLFCVNSPVLLRSSNPIGNFGFASPVVPFDSFHETGHFDVFHQASTTSNFRDASIDANSMSSSRSSSPMESSSTTPSSMAADSPQKMPVDSPIMFSAPVPIAPVSLASPPLSPSNLYRSIHGDTHMSIMPSMIHDVELHHDFEHQMIPQPTTMRISLAPFQPNLLNNQPMFAEKVPENSFPFGKRSQSSEPEEEEFVSERRNARYISNNSYNTGHGRDAGSRRVRSRTMVSINSDPELENQRRKRLDRKAELARVSRQQRNDYISLLNGKLSLLKARLALYEDDNGQPHPYGAHVEDQFEMRKKGIGYNDRLRVDRSCK